MIRMMTRKISLQLPRMAVVEVVQGVMRPKWNILVCTWRENARCRFGTRLRSLVGRGKERT